MAAIGKITTLWYPKNTNAPSTYEDGYDFNRATASFAVADGVSSAIFSKQWAKVLVKATVDDWLPLNESKAISKWIRPLRKKWSDSLPEDMEWFQKEKLAQTGGGHSTLLGVQLDLESLKISAFSFGDCCFFLFRTNELIASFPASDSAYFGITPYSLASSRKPKEEFNPELFEVDLQLGDKIVLATDAIACWIFTQLEDGKLVTPEQFETLDEQTWTSFIEELRESRAIRVDDVTLQLIEVVQEGSEDFCLIGPSTEESGLFPTGQSSSEQQETTDVKLENDLTSTSSSQHEDELTPEPSSSKDSSSVEGHHSQVPTKHLTRTVDTPKVVDHVQPPVVDQSEPDDPELINGDSEVTSVPAVTANSNPNQQTHEEPVAAPGMPEPPVIISTPDLSVNSKQNAKRKIWGGVFVFLAAVIVTVLVGLGYLYA